jgi:hypothetical protein
MYRDDNTVRKLNSNFNRVNAINPSNGDKQTVESSYHVSSFNQAYLNHITKGFTIPDCVEDLVQVYLEVNTSLQYENEPRDVTKCRVWNIIYPEFLAFVDFRKDLGDEPFEMEFE